MWFSTTSSYPPGRASVLEIFYVQTHSVNTSEWVMIWIYKGIHRFMLRLCCTLMSWKVIKAITFSMEEFTDKCIVDQTTGKLGLVGGKYIIEMSFSSVSLMPIFVFFCFLAAMRWTIFLCFAPLLWRQSVERGKKWKQNLSVSHCLYNLLNN